MIIIIVIKSQYNRFSQVEKMFFLYKTKIVLFYLRKKEILWLNYFFAQNIIER